MQIIQIYRYKGRQTPVLCGTEELQRETAVIPLFMHSHWAKVNPLSGKNVC